MITAPIESRKANRIVGARPRAISNYRHHRHLRVIRVQYRYRFCQFHASLDLATCGPIELMINTSGSHAPSWIATAMYRLYALAGKIWMREKKQIHVGRRKTESKKGAKCLCACGGWLVADEVATCKFSWVAARRIENKPIRRAVTK